MSRFVIHRGYLYAVVSGLLLALTYYPFYCWPLAFVAFVLLLQVAVTSAFTKKEVFLAGCIVGVLGVGPLVYFSLAHLVLFPDSLFFTYAIRASSVLALAVIGALYGLLALGYRELRSRSTLLNISVAGALYTAIEYILFWIFGGYYYASLAHAVVSFPPALVFASIGGVPLVSFLVLSINALLCEVWVAGEQRKFDRLYPAVLVIAVCAVVALVYHLPQGRELRAPLDVSIIQVGRYLPFGSEVDGNFSDPSLEPLIQDAASGSDLVIYPFTPIKGVAFIGAPPSYLPASLENVDDASVGTWLSSLVPASTTVMLWNTLAAKGQLFDEDVFWADGHRSEYRKQEIYALSDAPPDWAKFIGLQKSPLVVTPGEPSSGATVSGVHAGTLICSELHQVSLARAHAKHSPFIIAVGSDYMFPGDLSGNFGIAAARYRAVENNVPVIRGNVSGPSAIINADGSIQQEALFGVDAILRGIVPIRENRGTLYSKLGDVPVYTFTLLALGLLLYRKIRTKSQ